MNGKMSYEYQNTITSLKNEIYGLKQLISDFKKLETADFSSIENKVINVKVERLLHAICDGYVSLGYNQYQKSHDFQLIVKERYNNETKGYIGFYDSFKVNLGINKEISEAGKQTDRFKTLETIGNIKKAREQLEETLKELETELLNIEQITKEYIEIYDKMREFKSKRTSFFISNFKLNGFY